MKDSTKRTITFTGGVLALASVGFAAAKAVKKSAAVVVEQDFTVQSDRVIDLIKQVELEPELIPFVSNVDVLEREKDHVTYQIRGNVPAPWWAIYKKWWDYSEKWVAWKSESGSYGLSHKGEIRFEDVHYGCKATLTTDYKFFAPVVGGLATQTSRPFVKSAMSTWLKRLSERMIRDEVAKHE